MTNPGVTYGPRVVGKEQYAVNRRNKVAGRDKYGPRVVGKKEKLEDQESVVIVQNFPDLTYSVHRLRLELERVTELSTLAAMAEAETQGQDRKGVYRAIAERREEILAATALSVEQLEGALGRSVEELDEFVNLELSRALPRRAALELFREVEVRNTNRDEMLELLDLALTRSPTAD